MTQPYAEHCSGKDPYQRLQRAILLHGAFKWGRSAWSGAQLRLVVGCNKSIIKNNLKINHLTLYFLFYKVNWI